MIFTLIVAATFIATSIILFFVTRSAAYTSYVERRLPANTGLTMPDGLAPALLSRNRAQILRVCIGIVVGSVAGVLVAVLVPGRDPWTFDGVTLVIAGVAAGGTIGICDWLRIEADRRATQEAPEHRPTGVRLRNYLSIWSLVAAAIVLLVAVVLIAISVWLPTTGALAPGGESQYLSRLTAYVVVTLTLFGGLAFAGLQLRKPQRATAPEQLAWDDAVSNQAVYQIAYLGSFLAAIIANQVAPGFMAALATGPATIDLRTGLVLLSFLPLPIFAAVIVAAFRKPAQHYLVTLWPSMPRS